VFFVSFVVRNPGSGCGEDNEKGQRRVRWEGLRTRRMGRSRHRQGVTRKGESPEVVRRRVPTNDVESLSQGSVGTDDNALFHGFPPRIGVFRFSSSLGYRNRIGAIQIAFVCFCTDKGFPAAGAMPRKALVRTLSRRDI